MQKRVIHGYGQFEQCSDSISRGHGGIRTNCPLPFCQHSTRDYYKINEKIGGSGGSSKSSKKFLKMNQHQNISKL